MATHRMRDGPGSQDQIYPPVCTYCSWWKPTEGHYCAAWPPGGRKQIPRSIWNGEDRHIMPVGGEQRDSDGQPIVFRLNARVKRTAENAALLDAYASAHP
jgi:hypothetical protein